jgi:hypothetical protein
MSGSIPTFPRLMRPSVIIMLLVMIWIQGSLSEAWAVGAREQSANLFAVESPAVIPVINEGRDFATRELRDPWDMSEFSDVSQFLNFSGWNDQLGDLRVQDGLFYARTHSTDAHFFVLFPGYKTAMLLGKVGVNYPIASATYKCAYVAMWADSVSDLRFYWYKDENLFFSSGVYTWSSRQAVSPNSWKLYSLNLATDSGATPVKWLDEPYWRGLSVNLTKTIGNNISVDWVRLTDCSAKNLVINASWSSDASIYVKPAGTTREILVTSNAQSSGSYNLDVQGFEPGEYTYIVKQNSTPVATGTFEVNADPVVRFNRPSAFSGVDFATSKGNAWDFNSSDDVIETLDLTTISYENGYMQFSTSQPYLDPQIKLKLLQNAWNPDYRYLTFRIYTDALFQNVPKGMVARWVWTIESLTGWPGNECHLVSQDIPFDVGWQVYSVDLWDAFEGSVEETSPAGPPHCPTLPVSWQQYYPSIKLRFDPNENQLDAPLTQRLDWIRLTKPDRVNQGAPYPIKVLLNKPVNEVSLTFYYTDTLSNKKKYPAQVYTHPEPPPMPGTNIIYLPLLGKPGEDPFLDNLEANLTYKWDTAGVALGNYYICAEAVDNHSSTLIYCSEVTIEVITP